MNRIIRFFEEVTTGSARPVDVHQISSSDPAIFLGVPVVTVFAIAKAIDYLIEKWKQIEEIRKVRAETKKLGVETALVSFDERIQAVVKESVEKQTKEIMNEYPGDSGRTHELEVGITWSLESLLARIERGLRVEIRMIEPPSVTADLDSASQQPALYSDLSAVARKLQFQEVRGQPILTLPAPEPPRGPLRE